MARPMGPRFKTARHLGENVFGHPKALKRGIKDHKKLSEFGRQLLEKQKLKAYYGLLEGQMRRYMEQAFKGQGHPGDILLQQLECRLDNLVYRLGFGSTLRQARQMVVHGHILVNGRKVDRPSFPAAPGDIVSLRERARRTGPFAENFLSSGLSVSYLGKNTERYEGTLLRLPQRNEIPIEVKDAPILEFYARR